MSSLKVITVPASYLSEAERRECNYAVVLGDCILPGFVLGQYFEADHADMMCRYYADHYGLRAMPLDDHNWHRPMPTLIREGAK